MAKSGDLTPVAITAVTVTLLIDAVVNDNTILGSDERIKLDGNVTISVQYLEELVIQFLFLRINQLAISRTDYAL